MYSASGGLPPWQNNLYGQPGGHPAYIPVPARNPYTNHSTPLPPPPTYVPTPLQPQASPPSSLNSQSFPQSSSAEPRKKTVWPQPVRDYVNRCFAAENQIPGIDRTSMETKLRQVITDAAQNNNLHTWDWATLPLPQQLIQEERKRSALGVYNSNSSFVPHPPVSFVPTTVSQSSGPDILRKRKSSELHAENGDTVQPPWRANKKPLSLEDRISPSDKRQKLNSSSLPISKSHLNLEQRKRRFEDDRSGSNSPRKSGFGDSSPLPVEPVGPVVGRSEKLEKRYFRLTSAPNPDDVRPLPILRQTLEHLKKKWKEEMNYGYICDQFKSLRQDLTVQHIKNEFTTTVYEIHARIALEKGDLGEYNQCQTQLRALYKLNLGGHPTEFKAYRILYYIYTCNRTDMNDVLSDLTTADKSSKAIKHALQVRSALALGNYHQFFRLYLNPPNMGAYVMDMFIERERFAALACMSRAYKPSVKLRFVTEELGFESDEETAQFILGHEGKELLEEKEDGVRVLMNKRLFQDLKDSAFSRVDIKGQI